MATSTLTAEARDALAATLTRELLRAAYSLTHRIHIVTHSVPFDTERARRLRREKIADLRAQRDLIDAELERRTAGAL